MNGFRRVGLDFLFEPAQVPIALLFQRVRDTGDEMHAQVAVFNAGSNDPEIIRHVNLMASPTRSGIADLIKELHTMNGRTSADEWQALMREGAKNVIRAHRKGREVQVTEGRIERPPPIEWLCQGLLLKNRPNCWLGAASTGKSTLAKSMCAYYATGFRFCEREMEQGVPLYLDWEDDHDSFNRVVYDVCHNLGVTSLPRMLWRDMRGFRLRDQIDALVQIIDREHVGLLVLDAVAAAGGSTGEHLTWEAIALEMERCLDGLGQVTVLALDHVTGAEHKAGMQGPVPIKARGAERKLEYTRNQWSLVTDESAAQCGRHVVNWYHTKLNAGLRERPFATEIVHHQDEVSINVQPIEVIVPDQEDEPDTKTRRLLAHLATTSGRTARELTLELEGHEPTRSQVETNRKLLNRAVERGQLLKDEHDPPRYACRQAEVQGRLITFPGSTA